LLSYSECKGVLMSFPFLYWSSEHIIMRSKIAPHVERILG
jgi:hypothetical protein